MVVSAVVLLVTLSSCAVGCPGNADSTELNLWRMKNQPLEVQLAAVLKEVESLNCEQTTLRQQQQNALTQMQTKRHGKGDQSKVAGTHTLTYSTSHEEDSYHSFEEASGRKNGPCFHYTVLDQALRATNSTTKTKRCDRHIKWKGWYRLFYNGKSLQTPERCVPVNKCGTHAPLWLAGPRPSRRQGIVTRRVCAHTKKNCCAFRSPPIRVKKCRGNYYVYKFTPPAARYLAYCADINTIVCGRCTRNQSCVSRDKINWRCKRKKTSSRKVHFFASYPGQITGKLSRVKYSKVLVNVGRAYNSRTGVFRAPVKGVYQFFFSTQSAVTGVKTDLWLVVNNYWRSCTHNCGKSWVNAASTTITFGGSLLVQWR